jgi:hypothetical protein
MSLDIKPTEKQHNSAKSFIKVMDNTLQPVSPSNVTIISKITKNIKTIKPAVPRYFENPEQISGATPSEYDLVSVFRLLKYEPYFLKATQKKVGLLVKSGFQIQSDNVEVKKYFDARFKYMFLQTKKSLTEIINKLAFYLIVCSNGFLVKVRDKQFPHAESYFQDGKEMAPVVGLFLAHPASMKPKWKVVRRKGKPCLEIEKWVHFNFRGETAEFNVDDVAHFTLLKEDGMVFGMPEVVPVIDDIRTLRKVEEDIQLLIYRDLFPIIHYKVESPGVIDSETGTTELDKAKSDMERIIQDGGIATDSRHTIEFVGNDSGGIDANPYLKHFQERVFTGLGVSATDMGLGADVSGNTATSMSKQLTDAVRNIQQELSKQFNELILTEMALQSPYGIECLQDENIPTLEFNEADIEWKIRQENHEADLFTKGVKTIDEVRFKLGENELTDEELNRTFQGLYGQMETDQQLEAQDHLARVGAAIAPKTIKSASGSTKQVSAAKDPGSPTKSSAADRDSVKSAKSNSNIVKSMRDSAEESISLKDTIKDALSGILSEENKIKKKFDIVVAMNKVYSLIKKEVTSSYIEGVNEARADMNLIQDSSPRIVSNIFERLDKLRDDVTNKLSKDSSYLNKAAARIATAMRTEKVRGRNVGYATACINNKRNKFVIFSDHEDVAPDSSQYIGTEIEIESNGFRNDLPPFRSNSRLKIKVV